MHYIVVCREPGTVLCYKPLASLSNMTALSDIHSHYISVGSHGKFTSTLQGSRSQSYRGDTYNTTLYYNYVVPFTIGSQPRTVWPFLYRLQALYTTKSFVRRWYTTAPGG